MSLNVIASGPDVPGRTRAALHGAFVLVATGGIQLSVVDGVKLDIISGCKLERVSGLSYKSADAELKNGEIRRQSNTAKLDSTQVKLAQGVFKGEFKDVILHA